MNNEKIILCTISGKLGILANEIPSTLDSDVNVGFYPRGAIGEVTWHEYMPAGPAYPYSNKVYPPPLSFAVQSNGDALLTGTRSIWFPENTSPRKLIATDRAGQSTFVQIPWATSLPLAWTLTGPNRIFSGVPVGETMSADYKFQGYTGGRAVTWQLDYPPSGWTVTDHGDGTATVSGPRPPITTVMYLSVVYV